MIKSIGILVIALSSFAVHPSFADELPPDLRLQTLGVVTNDRDPSVSTLSIVLDRQDRVEGIFFEHNKNDSPSSAIKKLHYLRSEIETDQGVVLDTDTEYKAFKLRGTIDSQQGVTKLIVSYLSNALTGSYRECRLDAVRDWNGIWSLVNAYSGRPITQIHAVTWTLGIKTVVNVCPN